MGTNCIEQSHIYNFAGTFISYPNNILLLLLDFLRQLNTSAPVGGIHRGDYNLTGVAVEQ